MKTVDKITALHQLSCSHLRGVGLRVAERLAHLSIHSIQDLLFHLPHRYQDRTRIYAIAAVTLGDHVVVEGTIEMVSLPKGGKTRFLCQLRDATGRLQLRFFYMNAAQMKTLQVGVRLRCFGEIRRGVHGFEMMHPEYQIVTLEMPLSVEKNLTPIYPTTDGLNQATLRKLTDQALVLLTEGGVLQDLIPEAILQQHGFPTLKEALCFVHRPPADAPVDSLLEKSHVTQKRLVFEELLAHRLSLLQLKKEFQTQHAIALPRQETLSKRFFAQLPFALTAAQQRVVNEISRDLQQPHPMLRLVQGDVGSGKTVVAALAMLQALENGYQCAVLAPTELLAEQHFRTFQQWFQSIEINVVLLSGQLKAAIRRDTLERIQTGAAHVIVGTHALFQKDVHFSALALLVVDEQHRFGVEQRTALREKGTYHHHNPHQLVMTATPIPRTLAMSMYADLDYSVIDELPPGRTPVNTIVIANSRREEVLSRIREACLSGKQVYWVCTLIEESEVLACQAAEETAAEMRAIFPDIRLGLLHGRLKQQEKEAIMAAFKQGDLQLLVATTVIEVGVDVPNASLMVIENAERLGLAQLHQLRGRVGRGSVASHCVLMYQAPLSAHAKARLSVMRETTDGFKIAQRDLEIRGPGEVLGTRQAGDIPLYMADLIRDSHLLPQVTQAADVLLNDHSEYVQLVIKRWLKDSIKYGRV